MIGPMGFEAHRARQNRLDDGPRPTPIVPCAGLLALVASGTNAPRILRIQLMP